MRTHQFSTSLGRCVGKGGQPGWLGRGEPSPARAPGPGPLSTGRAVRAWLPGSRSGETGPWPGAQQPPPGPGQPAETARGDEIEDHLAGAWTWRICTNSHVPQGPKGSRGRGRGTGPVTIRGREAQKGTRSPSARLQHNVETCSMGSSRSLAV